MGFIEFPRQPHVPQYQHRILYVGADRALLQQLEVALHPLDCGVAHYPADAGWLARATFRSDIYHLLYLFDAELTGTTGLALAQYARALPHRARTLIVILSAQGTTATTQADVRVLKPADSEGLLELIGQQIEWRQQWRARWTEPMCCEDFDGC